jgi:hypothetical protein
MDQSSEARHRELTKSLKYKQPDNLEELELECARLKICIEIQISKPNNDAVTDLTNRLNVLNEILTIRKQDGKS